LFTYGVCVKLCYTLLLSVCLASMCILVESWLTVASSVAKRV